MFDLKRHVERSLRAIEESRSPLIDLDLRQELGDEVGRLDAVFAADREMGLVLCRRILERIARRLALLHNVVGAAASAGCGSLLSMLTYDGTIPERLAPCVFLINRWGNDAAHPRGKEIDSPELDRRTARAPELLLDFLDWFLNLRDEDEAGRPRAVYRVNPWTGDLERGSVLDKILTNATRGEENMVVGCVGYEPFMGWKNGGPTGLYHRAVLHIAEMIGYSERRVKWKVLSWDNLLSNLRDGRVDFVPSVFPTFARARFADFTAALHEIDVGAITKKDGPRPERPSDLSKAGLTIAVVEGEIGHEVLQTRLGQDRARASIEVASSEDQMLEYVDKGIAHVGVVDALTCHRAERKGFVHLFKDNPIYTAQNGVMLAQRQPDLRNWLDTCFRLALTHPRLRKAEQEMLNEFPGIIRRAGAPRPIPEDEY